MVRFIFVVLILLFQQVWSADFSTISQISHYHGELAKDSIVLSNRTEDDLPLYGEVTIFRKGNMIYHSSSDSLEIEGYPGRVCTEFGTANEIKYLFELNDRPEPNRFLVLCVTKDSAYVIGTTNNNTAELFGDIDGDGKFEIGGKTEYSNAGDKSDLEVIQIGKTIERDDAITSALKSVDVRPAD